jgi:CelD/BcsL family acetyltransferase involved in cellulose biosynthesis
MIETHAGVAPLAEEWDRLCDAHASSPFLRPGWLDAWWRAFGRGELEVIARKDGDRLTGILPLAHEGGVVRSASNDHTPDYGFVADRDGARELADAAFSRGPRRVRLEYLDGATADVATFLDAARSAGYRSITQVSERPPHVAVEGSWENYEQELDSKVRRDLARRRRRLEEEGPVSVETDRGEERLEELLEEGFRLEGSGWKLARGTAINSRPETRRFYIDVARWAAGRGSLRLSFLRTGGRAVAFQLGIEENRIYYFVKGGYESNYVRFAPGKLLVQSLLERAFEQQQLSRFDFLGGDEPFKLEWTQRRRELYLFEAFAPSAAGRMGWAAERYGRPLARKLLRRMRRARLAP